MTGSTAFRLQQSESFERSLEKLARSQLFRKNRKALTELKDYLKAVVSKLVNQAPVTAVYPEPWPKATRSHGGWQLFKHYFRTPGQAGAAAEGRLIFRVHQEDRVVRLEWIYTHAEFSKRPPDDVLRSVLKKDDRRP